jgi:hypothetical protein
MFYESKPFNELAPSDFTLPCAFYFLKIAFFRRRNDDEKALLFSLMKFV